jgi:hypothetical protein
VPFKVVRCVTDRRARHNWQGTSGSLETIEINETTVFEGELNYGSNVGH